MPIAHLRANGADVPGGDRAAAADRSGEAVASSWRIATCEECPDTGVVGTGLAEVNSL